VDREPEVGASSRHAFEYLIRGPWAGPARSHPFCNLCLEFLARLEKSRHLCPLFHGSGSGFGRSGFELYAID
jgi:hypothetical protein